MLVDEARCKLSDLDWTYQSAQARFYTSGLANAIFKPESTAEIPKNFMCECYSPDNYNSYGDKEIAVATSGNIFLKDSNYTDTETWLGVVGNYYIAYPLATPIEVQLTPTQVNTILGQNNLYADSGDVIKLDYLAKEV